MASYKENYYKIISSLPKSTKLIAVSKTKPIPDIEEIYQYGQRAFGENKVQELITKRPLLPKDIKWNFIGHLQTNKVKAIIPFINLIHGVDSLKLLREINKEALKNNRIVDCLLQFHIATEETKFGLSIDEAKETCAALFQNPLQNIRITGVMGMATYTEDNQLIRKEFKQLRHHFELLKQSFFASEDYFKEISMGMSNDYHIAIDEGSTMVRIGSQIFGERNT